MVADALSKDKDFAEDNQGRSYNNPFSFNYWLSCVRIGIVRGYFYLRIGYIRVKILH